MCEGVCVCVGVFVCVFLLIPCLHTLVHVNSIDIGQNKTGQGSLNQWLYNVCNGVHLLIWSKWSTTTTSKYFTDMLSIFSYTVHAYVRVTDMYNIKILADKQYVNSVPCFS